MQQRLQQERARLRQQLTHQVQQQLQHLLQYQPSGSQLRFQSPIQPTVAEPPAQENINDLIQKLYLCERSQAILSAVDLLQQQPDGTAVSSPVASPAPVSASKPIPALEPNPEPELKLKPEPELEPEPPSKQSLASLSLSSSSSSSAQSQWELGPPAIYTDPDSDQYCVEVVAAELAAANPDAVNRAIALPCELDYTNAMYLHPRGLAYDDREVPVHVAREIIEIIRAFSIVVDVVTFAGVLEAVHIITNHAYHTDTVRHVANSYLGTMFFSYTDTGANGIFYRYQGYRCVDRSSIEPRNPACLSDDFNIVVVYEAFAPFNDTSTSPVSIDDRAPKARMPYVHVTYLLAAFYQTANSISPPLGTALSDGAIIISRVANMLWDCCNNYDSMFNVTKKASTTRSHSQHVAVHGTRFPTADEYFDAKKSLQIPGAVKGRKSASPVPVSASGSSLPPVVELDETW